MRYLNFFSCLFLTVFLIGCGNSNSSSTSTETVDSSTQVEESNANPAPEKTTTGAKEIPTQTKETKIEEVAKTSKEKIQTAAKEVKETISAAKKEVVTKPKSPSKPTEASAPALSPKKEAIVEKVKEEVKIAASKPEVAAPPVKVEKPAPPAPKAFSHTPWDQILRKHVNASGKVNYKGIKAEQGKLDAYLADLAANPVQGSWARGKKMAYWINAYNAFTIKLIVDNYPVAQITQLDGGKPWDKKWIKLGSKTYSLNDIEHSILRPQFKDPRIHFAVNCAAKSCPPVLNRAWTASNLNANFEKQTKSFINGAENEIKAKEVNLSKIFEWYGEDFTDLIAFLNKYSSTPIKPNAKINFRDYNWDLNE